MAEREIRASSLEVGDLYAEDGMDEVRIAKLDQHGDTILVTDVEGYETSLDIDTVVALIDRPTFTEDRHARIRRRFAVILEDSMIVPVPDDVDDIGEWATANYDRLLAQAVEYRDAREAGNAAEMDRLAAAHAPTIEWEDEHHADVDSIDDEIIAEPYTD